MYPAFRSERVSRAGPPWEASELTRGRRTSTLARKTPILPGLTARKDCVSHAPRLPPRGFSFSHPQRPCPGCTGIDEGSLENVSEIGKNSSLPNWIVILIPYYHLRRVQLSRHSLSKFDECRFPAKITQARQRPNLRLLLIPPCIVSRVPLYSFVLT